MKNVICKNFVELAYVLLPKNSVDKYVVEKDREIKREDYFHNLNLYNESVKKQKQRHKDVEEVL